MNRTRPEAGQPKTTVNVGLDPVQAGLAALAATVARLDGQEW